MAKEDTSKHARDKGANPFDNPAGGGRDRNAGAVNPSGPTTGTEGFGLGPGEASTTGVGQGTLGSKTRDASVMGSKGRGGSLQTPAARADSGGSAARTFRCSDLGNVDCRWEISGTPDDMLPHIERHAREEHGIRDFDERTRRKVIDAMRERHAA